MQSPARRRSFAGQRVRALRRQTGLAQAAMATRLGLSVSYLSQIENDDRPLTPAVLLALARAFPSDWADVDEDGHEALLVDAHDAATDPSVSEALPADEDIGRAARQHRRSPAG